MASQKIFSAASSAFNVPIKGAVRVDSKGRISIPASLRRSFGLKEGGKLELFFDLREGAILLVNSQTNAGLEPGKNTVYKTKGEINGRK